MLEQNDILDIPGLRAGRQGAEQGKRSSADTLEEQLEFERQLQQAASEHPAYAERVAAFLDRQPVTSG